MFDLTQGEWNNLIYSIILLAMLISSLFIRSTTDINKKLKNLSIWLFIIFLIVILYNNRFLFKNFIPYNAYDTGNNELKILKSNDNHFHISIDVNGKKVLFLIDTGATTTTLTLKDARRVGIDTEKLSFNVPLNTANGLSFAASAEITDIQIGNFTVDSMWILVSKDLDGESLLGMNFLNKLRGYDIRQDQMTLYY